MPNIQNQENIIGRFRSWHFSDYEGASFGYCFIGRVTPPEGLTVYNSTENGGSVGDNGFRLE